MEAHENRQAVEGTEVREVDARIAAVWAQDATVEHASIASFARFTLELLAVGAPPRFLIASQDAGRDEVQHAQKCFSIASRLTGKKLGPGPLDVSGVEGPRDLTSIAVATVSEGCVNETLSGLLAHARAAGARDPDIRAALTKIAADETGHGELAWKFVTWAVERGGEPIREAVKAAFADAISKPLSGFNRLLVGVPAEDLRTYGLLDEATSREVVRHAYEDVIAPRAAALVAASSNA